MGVLDLTFLVVMDGIGRVRRDGASYGRGSIGGVGTATRERERGDVEVEKRWQDWRDVLRASEQSRWLWVGVRSWR